eukprot:1133809-Pelagomonas_calceolata.AAC.4
MHAACQKDGLCAICTFTGSVVPLTQKRVRVQCSEASGSKAVDQDQGVVALENLRGGGRQEVEGQKRHPSLAHTIELVLFSANFFPDLYLSAWVDRMNIGSAKHLVFGQRPCFSTGRRYFWVAKIAWCMAHQDPPHHQPSSSSSAREQPKMHRLCGRKSWWEITERLVCDPLLLFFQLTLLLKSYAGHLLGTTRLVCDSTL